MFFYWGTQRSSFSLECESLEEYWFCICTMSKITYTNHQGRKWKREMNIFPECLNEMNISWVTSIHNMIEEMADLSNKYFIHNESKMFHFKLLIIFFRNKPKSSINRISLTITISNQENTLSIRGFTSFSHIIRPEESETSWSTAWDT